MRPPYLVALVQQAQANLAPHSRISRLVIDRAYVDGASLHALHELGITFVVIAKANMVVRDVALALSAAARVSMPSRRRKSACSIGPKALAPIASTARASA